jgi:hypothetical protein
MTFHPKNLLVFAAFIAALALAASARAGHVSTSVAMVGVAGVVAIEAALFFGLFAGRRRTR